MSNNLTLKNVKIQNKRIQATALLTFVNSSFKWLNITPLLGETYFIEVNGGAIPTGKNASTPDTEVLGLPEGVYSKTGDGQKSLEELPWDHNIHSFNSQLSNVSTNTSNIEANAAAIQSIQNFIGLNKGQVTANLANTTWIKVALTPKTFKVANNEANTVPKFKLSLIVGTKGAETYLINIGSVSDAIAGDYVEAAGIRLTSSYQSQEVDNFWLGYNSDIIEILFQVKNPEQIVADIVSQKIESAKGAGENAYFEHKIVTTDVKGPSLTRDATTTLYGQISIFDLTNISDELDLSNYFALNGDNTVSGKTTFDADIKLKHSLNLCGSISNIAHYNTATSNTGKVILSLKSSSNELDIGHSDLQLEFTGSQDNPTYNSKNIVLATDTVTASADGLITSADYQLLHEIDNSRINVFTKKIMPSSSEGQEGSITIVVN